MDHLFAPMVCLLAWKLMQTVCELYLNLLLLELCSGKLRDAGKE